MPVDLEEEGRRKGESSVVGGEGEVSTWTILEIETRKEMQKARRIVVYIEVRINRIVIQIQNFPHCPKRKKEKLHLKRHTIVPKNTNF